MTQRRYYSEEQIIKAIDGCHRASETGLKKVEALEEQIRQLRADPKCSHISIEALRITQRRWAKYATNQIEKKAKRLKESWRSTGPKCFPLAPERQRNCAWKIAV